MAYTIPPDIASGHEFVEGNWDTHIRANFIDHESRLVAAEKNLHRMVLMAPSVSTVTGSNMGTAIEWVTGTEVGPSNVRTTTTGTTVVDVESSVDRVYRCMGWLKFSSNSTIYGYAPAQLTWEPATAASYLNTKTIADMQIGGGDGRIPAELDGTPTVGLHYGLINRDSGGTFVGTNYMSIDSILEVKKTDSEGPYLELANMDDYGTIYLNDGRLYVWEVGGG